VTQRSSSPAVESHGPEPLLRAHMPELDTLRGIAILSVLFLHAFYWQYSGLHFTGLAHSFLLATQPGWLGVNLFFVLSGFLITGILVDSKDKPQYFRRFYWRRALRILPAYYLLLILLSVLHQASTGFLALSFVYLANVTHLFGVSADYGPLWSLAVEEHYYIFWPAVIRNLTSRNIVGVTVGICVLTPVLRAVAFYFGYTSGLGWYTWFVADGLATGSLLAILLRGEISRRTVSQLSGALLVVGLAMAACGGPFGILTRNRMLGAALQETVIDLIFAAVLLFVLVIGTSSKKSYVNSRILKFLGYISYGLYLIHLMVFRIYDKLCREFWPILIPTREHFGLVVLRFVVAGGAAVGLAYLSRKYFEERFLRMKDKIITAQAERDSSTCAGGATEKVPAEA
jgi:peptidoglycan/LPS O-acetylase OafA/YrhL